MRKKVIISDDNATFLMYVGLLLKRFDLKVFPTENGVELLKLLKYTDADAVLLDVHMQQMDGFTVLRYLKEDKKTSHIPVIMISADSSSETVEQCRQMGCFDYLTKPLKVDRLHDTLQACFFSQSGIFRRSLRTLCQIKVAVAYNGARYELYAESLSEGGIYIRMEKPLPAGSEVEVSVPLGNGYAIQAKGTVVYTKKLYGDFLSLSPGMAVKFNGLASDASETLKFYIEDLIAQDIFAGQEEKLIVR